MENNQNTIPIVKPQTETKNFLPQQAIDAMKAHQSQNAPKRKLIDVELPSKGWFYPESSPLSSGVVRIKEMGAKEEDILVNQKLIKNGTVINELLKALIIEPTNCLNELISGDANAVFYAIRIAAYGNKYKTKVRCPECNEESKYVIDLSEVKNSDYDFSNCTKGKNEFEFKLPHAGNNVVLKLINQKDENDISTELKAFSKINSTSSSEMTTRLKYMLVSIDGKTEKSQIKNFIDTQLLSKDSLEIREFYKSIMPDIDAKFNFTCPHCGHVDRIAIPIAHEFLYPNGIQ